MIDWLSNPAWINPQIDFLLWLQHFRIGHFEDFDKFFLSVTIFGEYWIPTIVCAIIYWCMDFKSGVYIFTVSGLNILIAHFFKMIACVYRPWILDNRLHPSELAVPYAKGYSFPSGHSANSSSVFGGSAYLFRKHKILCILLIILVLFVGFSRLWLGVHTPQDVIVGFAIGFSLIFAVNPIINWAEKNPNRYLYLAGIINLISILTLIYICYFGTYRIDYINGELLVDPQQSIYLTVIITGFSLGLVNGCLLCGKYCRFNPKEMPVSYRIAVGIIGTAGITVLIKNIFWYIFTHTLDYKIGFLSMFLIGITITLIYPVIFTKIRKLMN